MAGGSLLALLDDIASMLDDISLMTKVAAKKTAGVLGDDLALNAEQVSGVRAERELPVVWAVAKGSLKNKAILVPAALAISAVAPWAITPILMLGGTFLCYEGFEKLAHKFFHSPEEDAAQRAELTAARAKSEAAILALEKDKIKGAIRTDFILSAEIIVITLGVVADMDFVGRLVVLSIVAVMITLSVYGLVGGIVKLDDLGLYLSQKTGESWRLRFLRSLGRGILHAAPWLMKSLSVVGTAAMFLVGGGILIHGLPFLHHWQEALLAGYQGWLGTLGSTLFNALVGILVGAVVLLAMIPVKRLLVTRQAAKQTVKKQ